MISYLNPGSSVFLADLSQIKTANEQTQQQISSGRKIEQPSDSPDQISELLMLQSQLSANTQVQANLTGMQAVASSADGALSNALQLSDNALSLASQGAGTTATAQTRQQLAQQVQDILGEVVSLTQTSQNGRFVFGGDADRTPPYQVDLSSLTGVTGDSTVTNTLTVEDTNGNRFAAGLSAAQIFDARNTDGTPAPQNFFNAFQSLYTALNSNDTAGINNAITLIGQAVSYVNVQQGFYGALENRLTESLTVATAQSTQITKRVTELRDTDISQAAVQLTEGATQYQAALAAQAKLPQTSLFNYLS